MRSFLAFLLFVVSIPLSTDAADWHHPLAIDGGDYWKARLPVRITNKGDSGLEGFPFALSIDKDGSAAALVGLEAREIRVTNEIGTEMLFAVHGAGGEAIDEGPIPAGASIVLPVECEAKSSATYYVYFNNAAAGRVPDYLKARPGLVNGSVELGSGDTPDGWRHDIEDEEHRSIWSTENPRSGKRCLKTIVKPGTEATWIASRQGGIHLAGGARYRVEAWVRAENVKGYTGWYLHVGNAQNSMLVAPTLQAGEGTFDWKKITHEFTVPEEADLLSLGTVLRGTGTAWFDDIALTCLEPGSVQADVRPIERMELKEIGGIEEASSWPGSAPSRRAVVRVYNFDDEPTTGAMASIDMDMIRGRARGRLDLDSIRVVLGRRVVPHTLLGNALLFRNELPARAVATYEVYFSDDRLPGMSDELPTTSDLLPNLVVNGSFEKGRPLPEAWSPTGPAVGKDGVRFSLDDPGRTDLESACARMDVPEGLPESWRGWRQTVPVRSGATYLLSAWLKCEGIEAGEVRVHVHLRKVDGGLSKTGAMTGISQGITGTSGWTLVSGLFTMPEDAAQFQIHLTTTASGTVWHDGVSLAEVESGPIARFECRPLPSADDFAMWQVPSVVKVFPDDPAGEETVAHIAAAGNEQEVLQLAVRAGRSIDDVRVRAELVAVPEDSKGSESQSGSRAKLPSPDIQMVGYVPIDYPTSYYQSDAPAWHRLIPTQRPQCDGWAGLWPDPLLPTDRFDLAANTTQAVWLTFDVPKNAAPGNYLWRVRFESGDRVLAEQDFTVHVWDFSLPDENHVAAIYDVRYGRGGSQFWGKPLSEMYPELVRFLADRRLSPDSIKPEPKIRYVDGRVEADFTEYDKAAEYYFNELGLPFSYTPWTFYLFGWGHPPKTFFGERPYEGEPPYEDADRSQLRPEYKKAYQACLKVFWDHVKEKGWADRIILYISDEPHDWHAHIGVQMKALCDMIHEVDPAIRIYSSTWKHVPDWDGYLDVWGIGHYGRVAVDKIAELQKAGDRIWFTTDGQMCTDTPYCAVERLLPHYCFKYGAQAYEFWGASWLTYDPYRYGWHSYIRQSSEPGKYYWIRYPNGDGFLIYPGGPIDQVEPVSSIRLENAREGVEDYEYLYRLKGLVDQAKAVGRDVSQAEAALTAAAELVEIPNAGGRYSSKILPDPGALLRTRIQVAEAIEGLSKK